MRIGIDMGHGGIDPKTGKYVTSGKRSLHPVDGKMFYEGVNNRLYGKEWEKVLTNYGHDVVFVTDPNDYKDVSLTQRVRTANSLELDLLISIHSNGASDPTVRGHEVFTSPGFDYSDEFAEVWGRRFIEKFPHIPYRYGKSKAFDKEKLFTIIAGNRHVKPNYNAILIELDFHTNDDAVRELRDWHFRLQTAICCAEALKNL